MAVNAATVDDVAYIGFVLGPGGDALQMLDLARGVRDLGARVRIIVPEIPSSVAFAERCHAAGVDCERSPLIRASYEGSRQDLLSVRRLLRSVKAPIVHFHTGDSLLPRSVLFILEMLRYRRCFVTIHSPYETIEPGSWRARFWATTSRRRFAAVVTPSDHARRFQLRCGVASSVATTIRTSVDVAAMRSGDARTARTSLDIPGDALLVVFSSRIDHQKRPVDAVRIFAGVASEFPTAQLVLVGQGDERAAVVDEATRLGISARVRLVGYQTNVADWLAAATVWLLPTERENFSVAVLEALAAGCAVLSTTCPGNDEVLTDHENAVLFPVGDISAGTAGLRELLTDGALRRRLGEVAQKSAAPYTVDRMVDDYRAMYNRSPVVPSVLRLPPNEPGDPAVISPLDAAPRR